MTLPDLIIAGMIAEGLGLFALRALFGRGPRRIGANLMAGGCLLLAWRASDAGASLVTISALLAAALVAHVLDLALRWREPAPQSRIPTATVSVRAARRTGPR